MADTRFAERKKSTRGRKRRNGRSSLVAGSKSAVGRGGAVEEGEVERKDPRRWMRMVLQSTI